MHPEVEPARTGSVAPWRAWALIGLGAVLIVLSIWRCFILQDVPVKLGHPRALAAPMRHVEGGDAIVLGALGLIAGATSLAIGLLSVRSRSSRPYDD